MEGHSYADAARRLRCPLGTVQSRLARGRERLRARIVRRGLAPVAVSALLAEGARASVPEVLAEATVKVAVATAQGTAAGAVSATVASLADYALRSMTMTVLKGAAAIAAAVSIALGAGLLAHGSRPAIDPSLPDPGSTVFGPRCICTARSPMPRPAEPIERFTLVPGWGPDAPGGRPEWLHGNPNNKTFAGGRYDIPDGLFPDQGFRRSIRIEADGYLPGEFLGFLDNVEDIAHDFKLRKASPLIGDRPRTRRPPAGRRRRGPEQCRQRRPDPERPAGGQPRRRRGVAHARPDPTAAIRSSRRREPVSVVVAHDAGFAVRSPEELAESTDVHARSLGPDRGRPEDRHQAGAQAEGGRLAARPGDSAAGSITTPQTDDIGPVRLRAGHSGPDDGLSLR